MAKSVFFSFFVVCFFVIYLVFSYPENSKAGEDFTETLTKYREEYNQSLNNMPLALSDRPESVFNFFDALEKKRQAHFQAWLQAMQNNMSDKAGVEIGFSKKYKDLFENAFVQLLDIGKQSREQKGYKRSIEVFETALRIKADNDTAAFNLGYVYFYWGTDLFDSGDEAGARKKIDLFHKYCKGRRECRNCGKGKKSAYFAKGKKLYKNASAKSFNAKDLKSACNILMWLNDIEPEYPGLAPLIAKCSNGIDCRTDLKAAITYFREKNDDDARRLLEDAKKNFSSECKQYASSQKDKYFAKGVSAFRIHEFDTALSDMKTAQWISFINQDEKSKIISQYKAILEQLIEGNRLFDEKKYKQASDVFQKIKQQTIPDEDSHIKYADIYIKRAYSQLSDQLFEKAEKLYELFLLSEFSYADYLNATSGLEKVIFGLSALENVRMVSVCDDYMNKIVLSYLELHYQKGKDLFEAHRYQEAYCHFKLVEKVDQKYKEVGSYLRVIGTQLKNEGIPSCPI